MHAFKKLIYINVKQRKETYFSIRFFIIFSKLSFFFLRIFSFVYAFVDVLLSIFEKFSNSSKDFKIRNVRERRRVIDIKYYECSRIRILYVDAFEHDCIRIHFSL